MEKFEKELLNRFLGPIATYILIVVVGTVGYFRFSQTDASWVDAFYMTMITITTIGYGEVIDISANPSARIFTVALAVCGIGVSGYLISTFTVFLVEGNLQKTFLKRRMRAMLEQLQSHYIICGAGRVGAHILDELHNTNRPFVVVEQNMDQIKVLLKQFEKLPFVRGDALNDENLSSAGIERAEGIFAATEDDNKNMIICLTARHLKPDIRIVAAANDIRNTQKMKRAGADCVIPPRFIGGLRMVSEMIRPTVVSFLDIMLRDKDKNLRVEEVVLKDDWIGSHLKDLNLARYRNTLLLALKDEDGWIFNPAPEQTLKKDEVLIVMTNPSERSQLVQEYS